VVLKVFVHCIEYRKAEVAEILELRTPDGSWKIQGLTGAGEATFENPTWCTPSYVICFQKANSWNLLAVGCCPSIVGRGIAPLPI